MAISHHSISSMWLITIISFYNVNYVLKCVFNNKIDADQLIKNKVLF